MLKKLFSYSIPCLNIILLIACSGSDSSNEIQLDTESPTITCLEDISITIGSNENGATVNYAIPVGSDNVSAITTQTAGLPSGALFPLGTTTNTYQAMDAAGNSATCTFKVIVTQTAPSNNKPYFIGLDPAPTGKEWVKIENLSDEFNATALDDVKWKNTDPASWIGRPPGLFTTNSVSVADGSLRLTADVLPSPQVVNGNTFTHEGSYIASNAAAQVGQYFECRMKANKTFMSSTFWLINKRNDGTGCDKRTIELDIQECVGQITSTQSWAADADQRMGYNTHSRNTSCPETPVGSVGGKKALIDKAWKDYHIYAAWWKTATEIEFYLDGIKVGTATPSASFNLPMYLRMVVETYDWNPVPSDGGMTGSAADRTTYYDWVRSWELKDK